MALSPAVEPGDEGEAFAFGELGELSGAIAACVVELRDDGRSLGDRALGLELENVALVKSETVLPIPLAASSLCLALATQRGARQPRHALAPELALNSRASRLRLLRPGSRNSEVVTSHVTPWRLIGPKRRGTSFARLCRDHGEEIGIRGTGM